MKANPYGQPCLTPIPAEAQESHLIIDRRGAAQHATGTFILSESDLIALQPIFDMLAARGRQFRRKTGQVRSIVSKGASTEDAKPPCQNEL